MACAYSASAVTPEALDTLEVGLARVTARLGRSPAHSAELENLTSAFFCVRPGIARTHLAEAFVAITLSDLIAA